MERKSAVVVALLALSLMAVAGIVEDVAADPGDGPGVPALVSELRENARALKAIASELRDIKRECK